MPYAKGLTENEKQVSQREFFLQFYNNLDIKNSATEVYLEMTCYGGLAPFLHKAQQAYYVNSAFRKRILGDAANSLTSSPRFCPECWNEFPAYYRRHQIPGVSVCSKHHCLLHMNQNGLDVPCAPNASWDIMERYAAFAEDILSCGQMLISKQQRRLSSKQFRRRTTMILLVNMKICGWTWRAMARFLKMDFPNI